jgi:hypothetical protein
MLNIRPKLSAEATFGRTLVTMNAIVPRYTAETFGRSHFWSDTSYHERNRPTISYSAAFFRGNHHQGRQYLYLSKCRREGKLGTGKSHFRQRGQSVQHVYSATLTDMNRTSIDPPNKPHSLSN